MKSMSLVDLHLVVAPLDCDLRLFVATLEVPK